MFEVEYFMSRVRVLSGVCGIALASALNCVPFACVVNAGSAQQGFKNSPAFVKNSKTHATPNASGKFLGRGGYSYTQQDTINTYGDSRSLYGAALSLRDPQMDRQSNGGPFDQGFFFDSAITPRGGEAPYLN